MSLTQAEIDALNDATVAYYKFDGDATDATENGNDGTVYGATLTTGKINEGYSFDGSDDWIGTPVGAEVNHLFADSTTDWSVYAWFNYDGSDGIICGCAGGIGSSTTFALYVEDNDLKCRIRGTSSDNLVKSNLDSSNFHFVCATWDGTDVLVYYNDESPVAVGIGTSSNQEYNFGIADPREGTLSNFNRFGGVVDEVALFDYALTSDEVEFPYANGNPNENQQYEFILPYHIKSIANLNGSPVEGATVRLINQSTDSYVGETETNANGEYTFENLVEDDFYHVSGEYKDASDDTYRGFSFPYVKAEVDEE